MEITGNDAAAAGLVDSNARSPAKRLLDQRRVLKTRPRTRRARLRDQALRPTGSRLARSRRTRLRWRVRV